MMNVLSQGVMLLKTGVQRGVKGCGVCSICFSVLTIAGQGKGCKQPDGKEAYDMCVGTSPQSTNHKDPDTGMAVKE